MDLIKDNGGRRGREVKRIRYTAQQREWAIEQMMPPVNRAIVELSKATGITQITLRTWQKAARLEGKIVPGDGKQSNQWSSADKFRVVLETAPLSEVELSEYCRRKGIYPEQIAQWRQACERANDMDAAKLSPAERKRIRELERSLQRKEAALAEANALLELRKKAEAIWGKEKGE
jgi:Transposase